jgi:hypothetical protein
VTQVLRVARFRFRATFTHRWAGYLGLVILIALTGGLAMGAIAAGRRTRAAFPAFLASTNPSVAAVIGIVVGVPVGVVLGRWLWILFARQIFAVPQPIVPVWSVVLVALGALVVANAMAALPGRRAARTPTALLLRAE